MTAERTAADVEAEDHAVAAALHTHLETAAHPGRLVSHTTIWGKPYTWWEKDQRLRLEPMAPDLVAQLIAGVAEGLT